jgi:hypothetical protein
MQGWNERLDVACRIKPSKELYFTSVEHRERELCARELSQELHAHRFNSSSFGKESARMAVRKSCAARTNSTGTLGQPHLVLRAASHLRLSA